MKKIYLNPYVSIMLVTLFCIGSGTLIVHTISLINFEYVHTLADYGL
jgi:hypothetical protein